MAEIDASWPDILAALARGGPLPAGASELFRPFFAPAEGRLVVGQFGQSIDGRIATPTGDSKYINGPDGLRHLHRLRALVDAVVVGVSTAVADDPGLDVRHCTGRSPARVVIDPRGRVPPDLRLFRDDGVRRIVLTDGRGIDGLPAGVEIVRVPATHEGFDPASVIEALAGLGLRRLLIEGGAYTVSRFLCAGALDRLHVIVAPFLIGAGPTGISMPTVRFLKDGIRPPTRVFPLGEDVLFDCDLAALKVS
jgi:riboflavin-specific deaminase-like protein